jgi:Lrp/AsnC family transcriptional regulator
MMPRPARNQFANFYRRTVPLENLLRRDFIWSKIIAEHELRSRTMIDDIDLRILAALQKDAGQSVSEIAREAGLSTAPCWRRIQKLEKDLIIRKRVALLDRGRLNAGVTVLIAVKTNKHTVEWLEKFRKAVKDIPEIVDIYRMSGEIDYLLKAYVPDIARYDAVYKKLISKIELTDVTSMFAMEELKSTTEIPLRFFRNY